MSSYSIMRLHPFGGYRSYGDFLAKRPELDALPYAQAAALVEAERTVYANGFVQCMAQLGIRADDVVCDLEPLQKRWAAEHGVAWTDRDWELEIAVEQIRRFRPEVVYVLAPDLLARMDGAEIKRRCPSVRLVLSQRGFPSRPEEHRNSDMLFSCQPNFVDYFLRNGINARLLYHAFDASILERIPVPGHAQRTVPLVFAGSSGYGFGWTHRDRVETLDALLGLGLLEAYVFEAPRTAGDALPPLTERHPGAAHPPVYGLDLFTILARSRTALNIHSNAAERVVGNIRMFEASGVGTCQICERGPNLADLYAEDEEVVAYSSREELVDKVRYLQDNPAEAERIGLRGQRRVLAEHTVLHRCREIDAAIRELL